MGRESVPSPDRIGRAGRRAWWPESTRAPIFPAPGTSKPELLTVVGFGSNLPAVHFWRPGDGTDQTGNEQRPTDNGRRATDNGSPDGRHAAPFPLGTRCLRLPLRDQLPDSQAHWLPSRGQVRSGQLASRRAGRLDTTHTSPGTIRVLVDADGRANKP